MLHQWYNRAVFMRKTYSLPVLANLFGTRLLARGERDFLGCEKQLAKLGSLNKSRTGDGPAATHRAEAGG